MRQVDVAVIGLGAMGSASLWRLAARGATVVGFEQFELGHDQGSSHGETRGTRMSYFESPQYVPLVREANQLWRELERACDVALLTLSGALMIGAADGDLVRGVLASARAHDLPHDVLDRDQVQRSYPRHRLTPDEIAVFDALAGFLRPEAAVQAMVARATGLGATVYRHVRVKAIEPDANGVRIVAGDLTCRARHAIIAVGPWLPGFLPDVRLPLTVERQVQAWFPLQDAARFTPERFPVFTHEIAPGRFRYGFPAIDGVTIKLAVHHEGVATRPESVDRAVHPEDLEPLQDFIREHLDGVGTEAVRGAVCMYTNTPDEDFVIGSLPDLPSVTVLSPCSGHGFKFAPVIGDAAADLALQGRTDYPIALFAPARFARGASSEECG